MIPRFVEVEHVNWIERHVEEVALSLAMVVCAGDAEKYNSARQKPVKNFGSNATDGSDKDLQYANADLKFGFPTLSRGSASSNADGRADRDLNQGNAW